MSQIQLIRNASGQLRPKLQPTNLDELSKLKDSERLAKLANGLEAEVQSYIAETVELNDTPRDLNQDPHIVVAKDDDESGSLYDKMEEVRHLTIESGSGNATGFESRSTGTSVWVLDGWKGVLGNLFTRYQNAPSVKTQTYKPGPLLEIVKTEQYQNPKHADRVRQTEWALTETEPGQYLFEHTHHDNSGLKSAPNIFRGIS